MEFLHKDIHSEPTLEFDPSCEIEIRNVSFASSGTESDQEESGSNSENEGDSGRIVGALVEHSIESEISDKNVPVFDANTLQT